MNWMSIISIISISLITWFTTHYYYQNQVSELKAKYAQELALQKSQSLELMNNQIKQEKQKYQELFDDYAKIRNDNASIHSTNEQLRKQLSSLSRLSANKSRKTLVKELNECREVAVGLSELAGQAYETFELIKRTDEIERKYNGQIVDKR